jgi:prophage regulatory protein
MMENLIRPNTLSKKLGVSIPTLYRLMKTPEFPDKIRISRQAIGFRESEIIEWMESQKESSNIELA